MANNFSKLPVQKNLNQAAINRVQEAIQSLGKSLPCKVVAVDATGCLVTVAFEVNTAPWTLPQIIIPKAEGKWGQSPTQIGDTGVTMPADTIISNITGVSSSLPNINVKPANLASLIFVPVSNKNFPSPNPNAYCLSGPEGVLLQTEDGQTQLIVNASGIQLVVGGVSVFSVGSAGATAEGDINVKGDVIADYTNTNISLKEHIHNAPGGDTGPPLP
jgi:hypothetical protein